jgi:hypothetical protein
MAATDSPSAGEPPPTPDGGSGALRSLLAGAGAGALMALVTYSVLAMPFYALARFLEPGRGLARPVVRDGILQLALPAALVLGVVVGIAVGVWHARGGRFPTGPDSYLR